MRGESGKRLSPSLPFTVNELENYSARTVDLSVATSFRLRLLISFPLRRRSSPSTTPSPFSTHKERMPRNHRTLLLPRRSANSVPTRATSSELLLSFPRAPTKKPSLAFPHHFQYRMLCSFFDPPEQRFRHDVGANSSPPDLQSSPLLCTTRNHYFSRLSVRVVPSQPGCSGSYQRMRVLNTCLTYSHPLTKTGVVSEKFFITSSITSTSTSHSESSRGRKLKPSQITKTIPHPHLERREDDSWVAQHCCALI